MKKLLIFTLTIILLTIYTAVSKTGAESIVNCGTSGATKADGLVSTIQIDGGFKTSSGACVVDNKAAFSPINIPNFASLKSLYFDQVRRSASVTKHTPLVGNSTHDDIHTPEAARRWRDGPMPPGRGNLFYIKKSGPSDGNLDITGPIKGSYPVVVFVEGNLNIGSIPDNKLIYGDSNSGLVFVVGGNVNIHKDVTQIDAVIISAGIICTAYDGSACPTENLTLSKLTINGSLISLSAPIQFKRSLIDNSQPAEVINHQVKYLVILRDLMSDTLQKWSEIP